MIIVFYHQTKTPIGFWYRQGLDPRSLIQLLKILPVELTETHTLSQFNINIIFFFGG